MDEPRFTFHLDSENIEQPRGWDEFEEALVRDDIKRHLYFDFPLTLTFFGEAFDIIFAKYTEDFNSMVNFVVFEKDNGAYKKIISADIKISTCTRNLTEKTVECDVDDASYQSRVFDNLKVKIKPSTTKTKSGLDMVGAPNKDLTVYNPVTGIDIPETRLAYDVRDCMKALIDFVSDNTIRFESDWYDELDNQEKLVIMTGTAFRGVSQKAEPEISIDSLFKELWKKHNLYLIIENPLIDPVIRLEKESYLFGSSERMALKDIKGLEQSIDVEKLYSSIVLGSTTFERAYSSEFLFPYFQFFSFVEESYGISGVIGVDNELDLVSQYVIDTNVFEDMLVNGNDRHDDKIMLVQYTETTNKATRGTYYDGLDIQPQGDGYLYNESLLNNNVATRFEYYGDLILNSGLLESNFLAQRTTEETISHNIRSDAGSPPITEYWQYNAAPYDNDTNPPGFDDGDNYDDGTFLYTAPSSGVFRFRAGVALTLMDKQQIEPVPGAPIPWPYDFPYVVNWRQAVTMGFKVNDDVFFSTEEVLVAMTNTQGNTSVQSIHRAIVAAGHQNTGTGTIGYTNSYIIERSLQLNQGDTVQVVQSIGVARINPPTIIPPEPGEWSYDLRLSGLEFKTIVTPGTGGDYEPANPNRVQLGIYEKEELGMTFQQWEMIKQNPTLKLILDTGSNDTRVTHCKKISRILATGKTSIEVSFNRLQPFI